MPHNNTPIYTEESVAPVLQKEGAAEQPVQEKKQATPMEVEPTEPKPEEFVADESDDEVDDDDVVGQEKDVPETNGQVKKLITKKGTGWENPSEGSEVKVHYVGKLLDGTVFDSSRTRNEPFQFKLGTGSVIKGWDASVKHMKKGEVALVTISPDYAYGASGSPPTIPPNSTLQFEIELLEWTDEKDVSEAKDGGIMKKILKEGEGWKTPKDDTFVKVHYKLTTLSNNMVVEERNDFEFTTGADEVPSGLDQAVQSMKKGEKALVTVKPQHAYGENGNAEKKIGPNETLRFEVELIHFEEEKNSWELSMDQKLELGLKYKEEGNKFFQQGYAKRASKKYKKALDLFPSNDEDKKEDQQQIAKSRSVTLPCHLNIAACHLKLNNFKEAKENADKAIKLDSNNVKAYFRRGSANFGLDMWELAERDFEKVLELEPNNKDVKMEMQKLRKRKAEQDKKDKKIYGGIFDKLAKLQEEKEKKKAETEAAPSSNATALSSEQAPMEVSN